MKTGSEAALVTSFDAIGFAGGGNRCYWQSGFWSIFSQAYPQSPRYYVAVSAGAYHCAMNLAGIGSEVRKRAFEFAERGLPDADWRRLRSGRSPFVVGELFDQFLAENFDENALVALRAAPPILIQVAHPPAWLPPALAAMGSIAAYQIEKLLSGGAHSKAGLHLGLSADWISTHDMKAPRDLVDAIMATSSVPPFLPVGKIAGRAALDGGLVDNPPLTKLSQTEAAGGRTLLLTTRFNRPLPPAPNRTVVGPTQEMAVDKFTVGDADGLRAAFDLGRRDGEAFVQMIEGDALSVVNPPRVG